MPYKDPQKRKEMLDRVRPKRGPVLVYRGSTAHIALGLMKMTRQSVTVQDLQRINPTILTKTAKGAFESLVAKELAEKTDAGFMITEKGVGVLYDIPVRFPVRQQASD